MTRTTHLDTLRSMRSRAARPFLILVVSSVAACRAGVDSPSGAERRAIADTLESFVKRAYDLSGAEGSATERLLSLYPDTGRVVSASGGRMMTSRDSLTQGIRDFWETVGRNMKEPRWIWEQMVTDVLGRRSAVVTATYRVPHRTPRGTPHELAGAMTLVFAKRGDRWVVVQEHLSDRPTGEAEMATRPD
jgi:ketosteroid isomerase-like protein